MSTVTINNSPVHSDIVVTNPYGVYNPNYKCDFHTGIDFAPTGSTIANPIMYSVCVGEVVEVTYTNALGYQVLIKDTDNRYWRYCHMLTTSPRSVGDQVNTSTIVGIMGSSGNSTGVHLHLEYATTASWNCSTFKDPADKLGIPNVTGTIVKYDGSAPPPTPPTPAGEIKRKFPWFIYDG